VAAVVDHGSHNALTIAQFVCIKLVALALRFEGWVLLSTIQGIGWISERKESRG